GFCIYLNVPIKKFPVSAGVMSSSGWLTFATRQPRQYHYVAQQMTWTEAQSYCKGAFADLATPESTEDIDQLVNSVPSANRSSEVWIGLYHEIKWRWSDGYTGSGEDNRNWENTGYDPNFYKATELCVFTQKGAGWHDDKCSRTYQFICYNGNDIAWGCYMLMSILLHNI
uniref:C-type lectin domain-containing protein n=1 Tax=Scophthalmus maximus TaxID=52904 RepID=A0A8D3B541_SCOMX